MSFYPLYHCSDDIFILFVFHLGENHGIQYCPLGLFRFQFLYFLIYQYLVLWFEIFSLCTLLSFMFHITKKFYFNTQFKCCIPFNHLELFLVKICHMGSFVANFTKTLWEIKKYIYILQIWLSESPFSFLVMLPKTLHPQLVLGLVNVEHFINSELDLRYLVTIKNLNLSLFLMFVIAKLTTLVNS